MNIYEKLATARADFKALNIKPSGLNKFVGYKYFDLVDILPYTTAIELKLKMLSVVEFGADKATLTVYNTEKPEEFITFLSPMSTADLSGCHAVQNLGAVETYIRRYLYLTAYEIVEAEALDNTQGKPDSYYEKPAEKQVKQEQRKELTLEQAGKLSFKGGRNQGVSFIDLPDRDLQWAADNLNNTYGEAAKMVLASRKQPTAEQGSIDDLMTADGNDLPF